MQDTQTNVRRGPIPVVLSEDMTGKEGRLVVITNASGTPKASLPTSKNDLAVHVLIGPASPNGLLTAGSVASVQPLCSEQQVRVRLNGAVNPGVELVLDVGASADYGKVKAKPATAGIYLSIGVAEEVGVDEQLLLVRPCIKIVEVGGWLGALATDPEAPVESNAWYNLTEHALKFRDNAATRVVGNLLLMFALVLGLLALAGPNTAQAATYTALGQTSAITGGMKAVTATDTLVVPGTLTVCQRRNESVPISPVKSVPP